MSERIYYVYVLFRPNGAPCYVGKGQGKRWAKHHGFGAKHYNKHLGRIIANAGGSLPAVIVRAELTEADAFATEIALIAAIGREANGGPLVNLTDGGDGVSGPKHTAESIKRTIDGCRAWLTGRPKSDAHRASLRIARALKPGFAGKRHSEETKAKMRLARAKQASPSAETKALMRAGLQKRADLGRNSKGQFFVIETPS